MALADLVDLGLDGLAVGLIRQGLELGQEVLEGGAFNGVGAAVAQCG